jgi:hypothetical protein
MEKRLVPAGKPDEIAQPEQRNKSFSRTPPKNSTEKKRGEWLERAQLTACVVRIGPHAENEAAGAGPASEANEKASTGPAGFTDWEDKHEDKQWHEETE